MATSLASERDRPEPGAASQPWPSSGAAWYAVGMLAIVLMLSQLDRGVITLLVQPIKRDLHLTDTQVSLLIGLAFILFYVMLGVPLSRFSDRKSRRTIIALGLSFWTAATAACGLAQNFWQLFACRVGIGAGEAVNGPATYSILADYFPREKLPRAIAVLNIGFLLGTGSSLIIGGLVIRLLPSVPDIVVPLIGTVHNWQLVFIAVGLPGLFVAALMMTVREPPRRGSAPTAVRRAAPFSEVLRFLNTNRAVYAPIFLSLAVGSIGSSGNAQWFPTFYQRTYGWTASQAGTALGTMGLIVGPLALVLGTWLVEHFHRRGRDDANLRVQLIGYSVAAPFAIIGPLMPNPWLALVCGGIALLFGSMGAPAQTAALQTITPNQMRGQVSSLYLLMLSAIGMGLGPSVVALITDYVLHAESQIRYAMSCSAAVMAPASALIVWSGVKPYGRTIARLRKAEG